MQSTQHPNVFKETESGRYYFRGTVDGFRLDKLSLKTKSFHKAVLAAKQLVALHNLEGLKLAINNIIALGTPE